MSTSHSQDHTAHVVATGTLTFPPRNSESVPADKSVSLEGLAEEIDTEQPAVDPVNDRPLPTLVFSKGESISLNTPITQADRQAEYFSLSLPSGFAFYPFKRLSASLVRGVQQSKLSRAAKESNLRYTVEAVTSCLGDGVNAMDLSIMDFFYVMYWLRLASYTKFDFTHVAVCTSQDHIKDVMDGKKDARTLRSIHVIKNTQLEETLLDVDAVNALEFSALQACNIKLGYAAMRDSVAFAEEFDPKLPDYEDMKYLCDQASLIHPSHGSLKERMAIVAKLDGDALRELEAYQDLQASFGVRESVVVSCKECGAAIRTTLSVSAHSFF